MFMFNDFKLQKQNITVGSRKCSTARIFFKPGTGLIKVNKLAIEEYFQNNHRYLLKILKPFNILNFKNDYDIKIIVKGGGLIGQCESIQLGIAHMLLKINPNFKKTLKKYKLLTRDSRIKERKKYGLKKARKASQYSKR